MDRKNKPKIGKRKLHCKECKVLKTEENCKFSDKKRGYTATLCRECTKLKYNTGYTHKKNCNCSNIQPLWAIGNLRKGARIL